MKVLIVGGSSSVGIATTRAFYREGHEVMTTYANSTRFSHHRMHHLDLRSKDDIADFTSGPLREFAPLDVAVLLPSVIFGKRLGDYHTSNEIQHATEVNFIGPAQLLRQLPEHMNKRSLILLMSSISGERGSYDPVYAATKAAINSLAKTLARELAPRTRVNALAPGLIEDSTMYHGMSHDNRNLHREKYGSLVTLEDVAQIIVDLTKPHWRHLNGAVVHMDGGLCG